MTGPAPRLRLYTTPGLYRQALIGLVSNGLSRGNDVAVLERRISSQAGKRHAIAMPMARVGIYLALRQLIVHGQKVILSPYTIADVVNMVICAGGVPVFADIERRTCNISAEEVARLIDRDTGAVLVTHFYGQMADVEKIGEICAAYDVPMLEDAAQAFGAQVSNKSAGSFGRAGIFSFGMFKNVNAFYGGMLITDDDALAEGIRTEMAGWPLHGGWHLGKKVLSGLITDAITWPLVFRTFTFRLFRWAFLNEADGINNKLKVDFAPEIKTIFPDAYKSRLTPLQARMILSQLEHVDQHTAIRIQSAERYYEKLSEIPELIVAPFFKDQSHIYWYYPIQCDDRWNLVAHCMRQGRDITMSYHKNCAALDCFAPYAAECPNADTTANSLIYLPTYPRYDEGEIDRTIKAVRSYFGC